jgi:hypothetical protein
MKDSLKSRPCKLPGIKAGVCPCCGEIVPLPRSYAHGGAVLGSWAVKFGFRPPSFPSFLSSAAALRCLDLITLQHLSIGGKSRNGRT